MTHIGDAGGGGPDLSRNRIRARLAAGEIVVGLTITTNNLETAVLAARLGFHFLWVEMEHAPISLESLRAIVLATRGLEAAVFARVPVVELWTAKRVLDQGVAGVIFPFVSDPALAKTAALACRYPPLGRRGSGAGLAAATWFEPGSYYDSADAHILTVAVVEEKRALEHIDEIAATPGIDVIFIGTSDLSFSLGLRGRQDDPQLRAAVETIVAAAQRNKKFLGRPAGSAAEVQRYRQQGFQLFQSVTELGLMQLGAKGILEPLGIEASSRESGALY
ncbi:MAG TPA: aldolase/citrate lyase family protein [Acidobacteriaceae bacterium]|nr:aldolase/citrate lyase family protein [Acidobacteriaceae bacterium]